MNRIDSLIHEIKEHETLELDESLEQEAFNRIEEKVFRVIREEQGMSDKKQSDTGDNVKNSNALNRVIVNKRVSKRSMRKKRLFFTLAAVFVMVLGLTVYAAKENEWDITLINFMGISNANTLQLENGIVEINQSCKSKCVEYGYEENGKETEIEIEMTATTSIGDKNEVYIRIETDYMLPEDFNPETDYVLPENHNLMIEPNKSGYASTVTYFEEDNKLGFLMSISNCQDINKAEISLKMENLYLYHDLGNVDAEQEKELLCEGAWNLNWRYQYQSNTKTRYMLHPFQADGVTYYMTKVEVSPISIRMEAFRMPWNRDKSHSDTWLEEIHFTDGTVISIDDESGSGMRNGMFAESYVGVEVFKDAIIPKKVEKVVIRGEEILVR